MVTGSPVRAPGARSASERKRDDIMRAALGLFTRDGYERTSYLLAYGPHR
jgi:AcrR family transcriptional regulator